MVCLRALALVSVCVCHICLCVCVRSHPQKDPTKDSPVLSGLQLSVPAGECCNTVVVRAACFHNQVRHTHSFTHTNTHLHTPASHTQHTTHTTHNTHNTLTHTYIHTHTHRHKPNSTTHKHTHTHTCTHTHTQHSNTQHTHKLNRTTHCPPKWVSMCTVWCLQQSHHHRSSHR